MKHRDPFVAGIKPSSPPGDLLEQAQKRLKVPPVTPEEWAQHYKDRLMVLSLDKDHEAIPNLLAQCFRQAMASARGGGAEGDSVQLDAAAITSGEVDHSGG